MLARTQTLLNSARHLTLPVATLASKPNDDGIQGLVERGHVLRVLREIGRQFVIDFAVPSYAIIVREHFPAAVAGARTGAVLMATLFGMALGGWMSGKVFDLTGSYEAAFLNGIAWNALNLSIAGWLWWRLRGPRPPLKEAVA